MNWGPVLAHDALAVRVETLAGQPVRVRLASADHPEDGHERLFPGDVVGLVRVSSIDPSNDSWVLVVDQRGPIAFPESEVYGIVPLHCSADRVTDWNEDATEAELGLPGPELPIVT